MSTTDREAGGVPGAGMGPGAESGIRIGRMEPDDMTAVLAIERSSFAVPWTRQTFGSLLDRRNTGMWVAESAGAVVGYAVVWAVLDQAELGNVAVAEGHRRRGIAVRLVETVLGWLEREGVGLVYLEVRESNEGAQRLYERLGFEPVGRRSGYYTRPTEDALVLRRGV